jgi:hypothetical protein
VVKQVINLLAIQKYRMNMIKQSNITEKIQKIKVGKPKSFPLDEVDAEVYRVMAAKLNKKVRKTSKASMPMYSIHKDKYRNLLIIIKNY